MRLTGLENGTRADNEEEKVDWLNVLSAIDPALVAAGDLFAAMSSEPSLQPLFGEDLLSEKFLRVINSNSEHNIGSGGSSKGTPSPNPTREQQHSNSNVNSISSMFAPSEQGRLGRCVSAAAAYFPVTQAVVSHYGRQVRNTLRWRYVFLFLTNSYLSLLALTAE